MLASYEVKAAAAGLAVCLLGISAAVYRASSKLLENAHWVAHTHDVLTQLEATATGVTGAETELRGFLLTDRESYLAPYSVALTETRRRLQAVRKITADSPRQQARIDKLEPLILHRLDLLDALLKIGHEQGFAAARRVLVFDRGPQYLDEIRQGIQEMERAEQDVLASRFAQQESSSRRLQWMVLLSCGAALFLLCVSLAVVLQDLSTVEAAFRKANYRVAHDTLTGLASRHSLMVQLDFAIAHAAGTGQPLSVCICDIDKFKSINDTHGHASGDEILASFGRLVGDGIRKGDVAGRIGGDEFCIVLPNTTADSAGPLIERLRESWECLEYHSPDGSVFSVTASFGVVQQSHERSAKELLHTADKALYCAKGEGRNRIHLVA
ncbi:MAG TPA: diguanylate cyclase [Bryobacteraceae bacterium]|nr:diguanylate cyclase [Bryobacteraceae bacterium]